MAIITNWGIHTTTPLFPLDVENESAVGKTDGTNGLYVRGRLDFKAILATTIPQNGVYQPILNTLKITTDSVDRIVLNTNTLDINLLTRVTSGSGFGIDTIASGPLYIGQTNATDIHIGQDGNTVYIHSNLDVIGNITYIHTQTLQVKDKNIEVNLDGTTLAADGAGITVLGDLNAAIAGVTYDSLLASKWKVGTNLSQSEIITADNTQTVYNKTVADLSLLRTDETGAGTLNDVDTDNKALIRLTTCSAITGLANGYDGKVIEIINASTYPVSIKHQDVGSVAANRIFNESLHEIILPIDGCLKLVYDAAITSWRPYSSVFYGYIPDWSSSTFYSVGQTMMSVGLGGKRKVWRCVVAHLSDTSSVIPDINALYWEIAGGGGSATIDIPAGENLTKGDLVYICWSASDTGRTIGSTYKLDVTDYYRKSFAGIIEADVLTGNTASIVVSGAVDTITGLTGSIEAGKSIFGNPSTPGSATHQSPNSLADSTRWTVKVATGLNANQCAVTFADSYKVGRTNIDNSAYTSLIGLLANHVEFANIKRLEIKYSAQSATLQEVGTLVISSFNSTYKFAAQGAGDSVVDFDINLSTGQVSAKTLDSIVSAEIFWKVVALDVSDIF